MRGTETKVMEFPPVMTRKQAAAYVQVSEATLDKMNIPHFEDGTGRLRVVRYVRTEIDRFLSVNTEKTQNEVM